MEFVVVNILVDRKCRVKVLIIEFGEFYVFLVIVVVDM